MKYLKQIIIIMIISFIGEILNLILPFPIPASIYGLVILFISLITGLIKLEMVRETGIFLIELMPVMFIPAAVGLIDSWGTLSSVFLPVITITIITTIIVMVVTGRITQRIIRKKDREEKGGTINE